MGLKDRRKNKVKQRVTRRKKRRKLAEQGLNPNDYYYGRFYVGHAAEGTE
ncbi:hypothetical protein ACFL5E_02040 [Candidatus Omnitrophota bacterium]